MRPWLVKLTAIAASVTQFFRGWFFTTSITKQLPSDVSVGRVEDIVDGRGDVEGDVL